ncbi:CCA tRNA nucleotidyltransferase [Acetobacter sp.]|uniref:CCA tRNA nucleotidyltransferase n=1 Tax=Acetobacter sp. TaxID=440 RepID=UPI0039EB8FF1
MNAPFISLRDLSVFPSLQQIWDVLPEARVVGGAVRDLLSNRPVSDFDLGTPEPPQTVMERLEAAGIRVIPTGLAHGTLTALVNGRGFEITTLRRDEETDGRHAQVAWTQSWREDAARRDFTINAMSCDSSGNVHDYFGGYADLNAGRVRFVGDAETRIREDALRIFRFFRFQARFGSVAPDTETLRAISRCVDMIARLSVERIWSELRRILVGPRVVEMFRLMQNTGVLTACLPELSGHEDGALRRLEAVIAIEAPARLDIRMAALLAGAGISLPVIEACLKRLRTSRQEAVAIIALLRDGPVPDPLTVATPKDGARLLAGTERDILLGRIWLAEAQQKDDGAGDYDPEKWRRLRQMLSDLPVPVFPLAGRDLLAAGLPPGPRIGEILTVVRSWWEEGGCTADKEKCLIHAKDIS